jgi:hypothetical protein
MSYKGTSEFIAYVEALEAKVERLEKAIQNARYLCINGDNRAKEVFVILNKALEGE